MRQGEMLKKLIESAIKCQRFAALVGKLSPQLDFEISNSRRSSSQAKAQVNPT
jgi:hypothetical protein